jgi:carbonic anhydrase/acetyltransferase-like protein (isoleucine patch superfamily)
LVTPHLPQLLCLGYRGILPEFTALPRCSGAVATVCGQVRMGGGAQLGEDAVVRGDGHEVRIGNDFFLGERSSVHVAHEQLPTLIGHNVTVGRHAVLRACRVGDGCVIEDRATVLDGVQLGAGCVLEANSVVPAGSVLDGAALYRGTPARLVRRLEPGELLRLRGRVRNAGTQPDEPSAPRTAAHAGSGAEQGFLALTAQVEGQLQMASDAGVWFGTRIDGGRQGVSVGAGSSLHDNCVAYAIAQPVQIGAAVTVEHNAALHDCRIGDRALIGASCFLNAGTVVEDDVLLEPGSITLPRQVLQAGWIWGGRPARALAPLSAQDRLRIEDSARIWRGYAAGFRQSFADFAQNRLLD